MMKLRINYLIVQPLFLWLRILAAIWVLLMLYYNRTDIIGFLWFSGAIQRTRGVVVVGAVVSTISFILGILVKDNLFTRKAWFELGWIATLTGIILQTFVVFTKVEQEQICSIFGRCAAIIFMILFLLRVLYLNNCSGGSKPKTSSE